MRPEAGAPERVTWGDAATMEITLRASLDWGTLELVWFMLNVKGATCFEVAAKSLFDQSFLEHLVFEPRWSVRSIQEAKPCVRNCCRGWRNTTSLMVSTNFIARFWRRLTEP